MKEASAILNNANDMHIDEYDWWVLWCNLTTQQNIWDFDKVVLPVEFNIQLSYDCIQR